MAHQESENINYEAKAEQRKGNFIARTVAAISGTVVGIFTGKYFVKKSLREYVHERLMSRDWTHGRLREIFSDIKEGTADTFSGAPTSPKNLRRWAEEIVSTGKTKLAGTAVGDKFVFSALKALMNERPEFIEKLTTAFEAEEKKLMAARDVRIDAAKNNATFKPEKVAEIIEKEESNFRTFSNMAKKKIVDNPIFDELIKPDRLGLKLRHAHNRGEIIAMSAVTAVAVGVIAYKAAKSYLKRNEKDGEEKLSFQSAVNAQREASPDAASARTA